MNPNDTNIKVDDTWLLRFSRNSKLPHEQGEIAKRTQGSAQFYVFDYYDKLICEKDVQDYAKCLGVEFGSSYLLGDSPIASNNMTLISLESDDSDDNDPFSSGDIDYDFPFLSLVMVTPLADLHEKDSISPTEQNVHDFLDRSIKLLGDEAHKSVDIFFDKYDNNDSGSDKPKAVIRVFHSMNFGNFCIAVRSKSVELGYYLAMRIRDIEIPLNADESEKAYCSTFTITCVRHSVDDNGVAVPPVSTCNGLSDSDIVLRLSLDQGALRKISAASEFVDSGGGFYGRYDVLLRLSMSEFLHVYPWLCAYKFGTKYPDDSDIMMSINNKENCLINVLKSRAGIYCINERVLVSGKVLKEISKDNEAFPEGGILSDKSYSYRLEQNRRIRKEKKEVNRKIKDLLQKGMSIPYYKREFMLYVEMIKDVWEEYESLRYQDDSVVNGNMFFSQIWLLLDIVDTYLNSMGSSSQDSSSQNERSYQDLLVNLRRAINSIGIFQKLMQSVNQQSMQAPNYEIQMHCDLEKLVIAYTEFARRFVSEHFMSVRTEKDLPNSTQYILPIFTIESAVDSIEAKPLFLLPYKIRKDNGLLETNPEKERLLLSIVLPDVDTLGNLYHTLPMICHELSHNFRVTTRESRNNALCKYITNKVAAYITKQWISKSCEGSIYVDFGVLEDMIQRPIADSLFSLYREYVGDTHATSNIGVVISNLLRILNQKVFVDTDSYTRSTPTVSIDMLKGVIMEMGRLYQNVDDISAAKWKHEFDECIKILGEAKKRKLKEEDYTRIRLLSQEMAKSTYFEYANWLLEMVDLCPFINENYDVTDKREKDNYKQYAQWLRDLSDKIYKIPIKQDRVDTWIINVEKTGIRIISDLRFETNKHYGDGRKLAETFANKKQHAEYAIHEYCRVLKNVSMLYASSYSETCESKGTFLKALKVQIRSDLEEVWEKYPETALLGAEKVQELILPLGIDQDNDELFKTTMLSVLNGLSDDYLVSLVSGSAQLYREVFADLGMCVALNLDTFGYLVVLGSAKTFKGNGHADNIIFDEFGLERALTVCSVLGDIPNEEFVIRCDNYYHGMIENIKEYISEENISSDWFLRYEGAVSKFLHGDNLPETRQLIGEMRSIINIEGITEADKLNRLLELMESLWFTSAYVFYYRHMVRAYVNGDLVTHYKDMYTDILKKDDFSRPFDSHVLMKVGQAYNNGTIEMDSLKEEKFKETLSFMIFSYYQNWSLYSRSCPDIARAKEWTYDLMGRNK